MPEEIQLITDEQKEVDYSINAKHILNNVSQYFDYEITVSELCPYGEALRFDVLGFHRYNKKIKGCEIKVSRSDFLGDKKWERYLPFCDYFLFAYVKGILQPEEVPKNIGLIEFYWEMKFYDNQPRLRSRIVRKCTRLPEVSKENYIKVLEGIALKCTRKMDNIL